MRGQTGVWEVEGSELVGQGEVEEAYSGNWDVHQNTIEDWSKSKVAEVGDSNIFAAAGDPEVEGAAAAAAAGEMTRFELPVYL